MGEGVLVGAIVREGDEVREIVMVEVGFGTWVWVATAVGGLRSNQPGEPP